MATALAGRSPRPAAARSPARRGASLLAWAPHTSARAASASPPRSRVAPRAPPRGQLPRAASSTPKLPDATKLMERLRELEAAKKADDRLKAAAVRQCKREVVEAKRRIAKELSAAQQAVKAGERDASRLAAAATVVEQISEKASKRRARQIEQADEEVRRGRAKQRDIVESLQGKMASVGEARGRLAHARFLATLLELSVAAAVPVYSGIELAASSQAEASGAILATAAKPSKMASPDTDASGSAPNTLDNAGQSSFIANPREEDESTRDSGSPGSDCAAKIGEFHDIRELSLHRAAYGISAASPHRVGKSNGSGATMACGSENATLHWAAPAVDSSLSPVENPSELDASRQAVYGKAVEEETALMLSLQRVAYRGGPMALCESNKTPLPFAAAAPAAASFAASMPAASMLATAMTAAAMSAAAAPAARIPAAAVSAAVTPLSAARAVATQALAPPAAHGGHSSKAVGFIDKRIGPWKLQTLQRQASVGDGTLHYLPPQASGALAYSTWAPTPISPLSYNFASPRAAPPPPFSLPRGSLHSLSTPASAFPVAYACLGSPRAAVPLTPYAPSLQGAWSPLTCQAEVVVGAVSDWAGATAPVARRGVGGRGAARFAAAVHKVTAKALREYGEAHQGDDDP